MNMFTNHAPYLFMNYINEYVHRYYNKICSHIFEFNCVQVQLNYKPNFKIILIFEFSLPMTLVWLRC